LGIPESEEGVGGVNDKSLLAEINQPPQTHFSTDKLLKIAYAYFMVKN